MSTVVGDGCSIAIDAADFSTPVTYFVVRVVVVVVVAAVAVVIDIFAFAERRLSFLKPWLMVVMQRVQEELVWDVNIFRKPKSKVASNLRFDGKRS